MCFFFSFLVLSIQNHTKSSLSTQSPHTMKIRFQITVKGFNIQTCGFRTYAYELGRSLNLTGIAAYTENDLLIEVEGSAANVHQFLEWIRLGPVDSDITDFECREIPFGGDKVFHVVGGFIPEKKSVKALVA